VAFKVKDLMINVLPAAGEALPCIQGTLPCAQGPIFCTHVTVCGLCTNHTCGCTRCTVILSCGCTALTCGCSRCTAFLSCGCTVISRFGCSVLSACTPCGSAISQITPPGPGIPGPGPESSFETLTALKAQLKQQLAEVESQQKAVEESLRPQTVAEVDELQSKLEAAIEELKARRAELTKKAK